VLSDATNSGAGTNLKVGAPVRSESMKKSTDPARSAGKFFFWVVPLHFLDLKAQLVVLVSVFVIVSTVCPVSCLLFFYSRCPPCPVICKSGGTCPPVSHGVDAIDHKSLSNRATLKHPSKRLRPNQVVRKQLTNLTLEPCIFASMVRNAVHNAFLNTPSPSK